MPHKRVAKSDHSTNSKAGDFLLESFVGQIYWRLRGAKAQLYPEEDPDWTVPEKYTQTSSSQEKGNADHHASGSDTPASNTSTLVETDRDGVHYANGSAPGLATPITALDDALARELGPVKSRTSQHQDRTGSGADVEKQQNDGEREKADKQGKQEEEPNKDDDSIVVTWYGDRDPANPQNWSLAKKCGVTFQLCLLTFSIYIGSAIYSPGYQSLNMTFGVDSTQATLGLTLFVLGYGIGPLFLSATSEIPQLGRNPAYIITLALFVIIQVPSALATSFRTLLALRFLAGFIGSPVLATGGASLGDIFGPKTRPFAIGIWGLAAVQGPVLGPLIGGFAIQARDWRWAFWILLWLDGFCLALLLWSFPETSATNILYRRAERLRKRTGNDKLKSQGEIDGASMGPKEIAMMTLVRPILLTFREPICFFLHLYIGLVYSILYVWIESFNLVFVEMYGFNLGENGLSYLGLFVGALIAFFGFCVYNKYRTIPRFRRQDGVITPEQRLPPAMVGAFLLPISLAWFGWTSNPSIHWIVPIIGSAPFSAGVFLLFQSALNYLGDAYPSQAASVYAGNDFVRSTMGAAFPLFAIGMFHKLGHGVAWGSTLLACLTVAFIPIPFALHRYGKALRMRSPYARHDI